MESGRATLTNLQNGSAQMAREFWEAGTEPLRHLTIQTGVLIALFVLLLWLIALFIRSATWRFGKPVARGLQVVTTFHTNNGTVALSPEEYIRAFAKKNAQSLLEANPTQTARMRWGAEKHKKVHNDYFVVTLVECSPESPRWLGTPVLTRELRVWRKSNPPKEGYIQLDGPSLRDVRDHNNSSVDDIDGTEVDGQYDLYLRKVSVLDIRHWLVHPNREVRIALWVTIISMIVPVLFDALFGSAGAN